MPHPAEKARIALEQVAKEAARGQKRSRPKYCADAVEEHKSAELHAVLASHGRRQNAQAGHKLGEHEHDAAAAREGVLSASNAGGGLERQLAEQTQYVVPLAAADEEPHDIRDERGHHTERKRQEKAEGTIDR